MKKLFLFFALLLMPLSVLASEADNLTDKCHITIDNKSYNALTDDRYPTYLNFSKDNVINIECEEKVSYIYIYYNVKSSKGILNDTQYIGENNFLHELIKLDNKTQNISIKYDEDYSLAEIYIFSDGSLPSWVEDWQLLEKADLMLFSAHADDEQLFFAGLMPTYIDKGYKIQVIYFTNHYNNTLRYHEQLEGLWAIGIKYYPVISLFSDAYSTSLEGAIKNLKASGYNEDDGLRYEVEQIRKYKPYVVVGHDENGEYSHGQHILSTYLLKDAIIKAADKEYDLESLEAFGSWQINKLYLHLYPEKQIILNYDISLESYNGKTAYEVSKLGYAKHYSQQYTWFTAWLNGENNEFTSATQIKTYNPAYYGLYYSNVGDDRNKNDMFENIVTKEPSIDIVNTTKETIKNIQEAIKRENHNGYLYIGLYILGFAVLMALIITFGRRKKRRK